MRYAFPLAAGRPQLRPRTITTLFTITDANVQLMLGANKFRESAQLVNVGPGRVVVSDTALRASRGDGVILEAGTVPWQWVSTDYLYAAAFTDTGLSVNAAGDLLAWSDFPADLISLTDDQVVAQVSVTEQVLS